MTYKGIRIEPLPANADSMTSRYSAVVGPETFRGTLLEVKERIDFALWQNERLKLLDAAEYWR
jgi:hypothetical protein